MLHSVCIVLEAEIDAERQLSDTVAWAMEALEGAMANLGAMLPPRKHALEEMDVTLGHLHHAEEVCLLAAQAYGDHCVKAAWTVVFASLQRANRRHVEALGTRSLPVASPLEVESCQR